MVDFVQHTLRDRADRYDDLIAQALEPESVQGSLLALGVSDTAFDVFDDKCFASHGSGSKKV